MIVRLRNYSASLRACTYILPSFAFALTFLLLWSQGDPIKPSLRYGVLLIALSVVWVIICEHHNLFTVDSMLRERTSLLVSGWAMFATYTIIAMTLYLSGESVIPRIFVVVSALLLLGLAASTRLVCRFLLRRLSIRHPARVLVVGTDRVARRAARRLQHFPYGRCVIYGYLHIPGTPVLVKDAPVWDFEDIAEIDPTRIDDILLAVPLDQSQKAAGALKHLEHMPRPVHAVVDLGGNFTVRNSVVKIGRLQLFDVATGPVDRWEYRVAKRFFDVSFATLVLLLSSPLFLLIAIAVKLSSQGPIFFRQERVGLFGKLFSMYKFRTMQIANPAESDTKWTTKDDSRCTKVGAFLRKTSLDELPQFINVIRGDMSVVGPRPERPHFVRQFRQEILRYDERHSVQVGITGWAQVNGWRGDTCIKQRVEHDLYYMRNWSLQLDVKIILITLLKGIWADNAY